MANIQVSDMCNNQPTILLQKTTNPPMTCWHADGLALLEEDDEFLDDHNRLFLTYSEVHRVIHSTMLRSEESTLERVTNGVTQNTMETLLMIAAGEATNGMHSTIYGAV